MVMNNDDQKNGPNPPIQTPINPNNDMSDTTDTHGINNITQNFTPNQSSLNQNDALPPTNNTMSSAMTERANEVASEPDPIASPSAIPNPVSQGNTPPPNPSPSNSLQDQMVQNNQFGMNTSTSPSVQGEQSVSGDMPDPESDDDTLANAQTVGFQVDEDPENPKPLNMGNDIDKGEEEAHK